MFNNVRTIYGVDLQMSMLLGKPYVPLKNTTLNEYFKVANENIPEGNYPTLKYMVLGVGGISNLGIDNDVLKTTTHAADHIALFKHIPFRLVQADIDLTVEDRAIYRLRKELIINGVNYIAYYMRLLDDNPHNGQIMKMTYDLNRDDKPILSEFNTNNVNVLTPSPIDVDVNIGDATEYIIKIETLSSRLTSTDFKYIKEAMSILGYTEMNVNELGICSGFDIDVDEIYEVSNSQICYHMSIDYDIQTMLINDTDVVISMDIGGAEPLISSY